MRKKILLFMLTGMLGLALCGCQGNQAEETVQSTEQEETKETDIVEDTTEQTEEKDEEGGGIGLQIKEQNKEQAEEQEGELTEEEKVEMEHENDPDYMGDMHDPWGSEPEDYIDLHYAENLDEETDGDGLISTQLNVAEDYGYIEEKDFKFVNEFDETVYYYEMELFHFNKGAVPKAVISYLNNYYEEKEAEEQQYGEELLDEDWEYRLAVENGEVEEDEDTMDDGTHTPYSKLFFQQIPYIGDDYVSLVYYESAYMGGIREYGTLEGITIDCKTGKEVTAAELLGIQNEAELRCEISNKMGVDALLTWDELDYYITDKAIIFFGKEYWMQGNYDDVIVWR